MGKILVGEICGVEFVMASQIQDAFAESLAKLAVPIDGKAARRLAQYHVLLCVWNTRMNLTGDTALTTALSRLYMDSLAPLALEGLFPDNADVIDVGSGAGFPGLPLAIARPDLSFVLLDSLNKRVRFLQEVVDTLGLTNVSCMHARAEDAAHQPALRERFLVAVARAVAPAPVLMELLLPFVRVGGHALCYKGPLAEEETASGIRAAAMLGGGTLVVKPVTVPDEPDWRHCVMYCPKEKPTQADYPRKAGLPAKAPL